MKYIKWLLPILLLVLASFSSLSMAVKVIVHPDEQAAMDQLIKKLNIPIDKIEIFPYEIKEKIYRDSYLIKNRFQYHAESQGGISIDTNKRNRVANLTISWTNLSDLQEISQFKDLVFLQLNSNNLKHLKGVSNLKELKELSVIGNDSLVDIGDLRDLPNLKEFNGAVLKNVSEARGLNNLPKLETFICNRCKLNDLTPIGKLKNLKTLEIGTIVKSISPLESLKKLEELDVTANNLIDASAVNGMTSIKSIIIHDSLLEEIKLSKSLVNLEYLRIVDSKLKEIPDFSPYKNMDRISIVRSDITSIEGLHGLHKLTELSLIENKKLTSVSSLRDFPMLKELKIERTPIITLGMGVYPNLEKLDISGTDITKLENFSNYPKLSQLFLNKTKVTSLEGAEDAPYLWHVQTDYSLRVGENGEILSRLAKRFNKPYMERQIKRKEESDRKKKERESKD